MIAAIVRTLSVWLVPSIRRRIVDVIRDHSSSGLRAPPAYRPNAAPLPCLANFSWPGLERLEGRCVCALMPTLLTREWIGNWICSAFHRRWWKPTWTGDARIELRCE